MTKLEKPPFYLESKTEYAFNFPYASCHKFISLLLQSRTYTNLTFESFVLHKDDEVV